jgi:hypothetical protein
MLDDSFNLEKDNTISFEDNEMNSISHPPGMMLFKSGNSWYTYAGHLMSDNPNHFLFYSTDLNIQIPINTTEVRFYDEYLLVGNSMQLYHSFYGDEVMAENFNSSRLVLRSSNNISYPISPDQKKYYKEPPNLSIIYSTIYYYCTCLYEMWCHHCQIGFWIASCCNNCSNCIPTDLKCMFCNQTGRIIVKTKSCTDSHINCY